MVEIRSQKGFEHWLQDKPAAIARTMAVRAALRVLPLANFDLMTVCIRALFTAWAANAWLSNKTISGWAADAASRVAADAYSNSRSSADATRSAAYAAYCADASDVAGAAAYAGRAAAYAAFAVGHAEVGTEAQFAIWDSVEADTNWIDAQDSYEPKYLLITSLWRNLNHTGHLLDIWKEFKTNLATRDENWTIWIEWYERRLSGEPLGWNVDPDAHEALVVGLVLESNEFWGRQPVEVNADIAARVGAARLPPRQVNNPTSATETLPTLPQQGHGPHYRLNAGQIVFAPQSALDVDHNDIGRLRSLLPVLKMLCNQAKTVFGQNLEHGDISDVVADYSRLLDNTIETIDYAQLAGYGLILGHLEAAANRQIEDRLRSEFEDKEKAVLKSLLDAHGPFILATEVGRELLADAEQYQRNAEQEQIYRKDGAALVQAAEQEGIVRSEEAQFTRTLAEDVGTGPAPERSAIFGRSAIRNFSIAVIGGGAIGACAVMGKDLWDAGQPFFTLLAGGLGLTSVEALKKSKPFQETISSRTSLIDKAGGFDGDEAAKYKQFAVLIMKEEDRLRRLAGTQREYAWLHEWLDWIKANYKP